MKTDHIQGMFTITYHNFIKLEIDSVVNYILFRFLRLSINSKFFALRVVIKISKFSYNLNKFQIPEFSGKF